MSSSVLFMVTLPFEEEEEEEEEEEGDRMEEIEKAESTVVVHVGENEVTESTAQKDALSLNSHSEEKNDVNNATSTDKTSSQEDIKPFKSLQKQKSVYNYKRRFEEIVRRFAIKIDATWIKNDGNDSWKILFELDGDKIDDLLNAFLTAGIGNNEYSSVSIIPINIHFPTAVEKDDKKVDDLQQFRQTVKSRMNVSQVVTSVKNGSQLTFDYIMLLILASMISAIGLLENSSVLLVASMLVSPLMGPILGGTFGLVLQSKQVWRPAVINELIGLSLCLLVGFVIGLLTFLSGISDTVTTEMKSRGEPRGLLVGLLVAIPSGAAVALSFLQGNFGSLVGVAISASLLPPAVNAGMFWAFAIVNSASDGTRLPLPTKIANFEPNDLGRLGAISMTLTLVNIVVIFVMGVAVLKIKEVAPKTATAITSSFWKKDLKETREMLHQHPGEENALEESVIQEFSKLKNIDLNNKATIQGRQGQAVLRELNRIVEGVEKDNEYTAVSNRLGMKPGSRLNQMKKVVGFNTGSSRFDVQPTNTVELVPSEYKYINRFKTTKYDEVDISNRPTESKKSVISVPADTLNVEANQTIKKSPSTQRANHVMSFSDLKTEGESENENLIPPV